MPKSECLAEFIAMLHQFHYGMNARVWNEGEYFQPFPITNSVKQGYVLALTLSSMVFSAMLTDDIQD